MTTRDESQGVVEETANTSTATREDGTSLSPPTETPPVKKR